MMYTGWFIIFPNEMTRIKMLNNAQHKMKHFYDNAEHMTAIFCVLVLLLQL